MAQIPVAKNFQCRFAISAQLAQVARIRDGAKAPLVLLRNGVLIALHFSFAPHYQFILAWFENENAQTRARTVAGQCVVVEAVIAIVVVFSTPAYGIEIAWYTR